MIETVEGVASVVEQLGERVRELERRVAVLEGRPKPTGPGQAVGAPLEAQAETQVTVTPTTALPPMQSGKPPATWTGFPPVETPAGALGAAGRAVLGIAGAYLLRAIAESGAMPKLPVLLVAIAYAGLWMVWAVRTYATSRFASVAYAITSALILSPLLWESTVRFQVLSPGFAGVVLVGYMVLTLMLAARRELRLIVWVATAAAVVTALALIFATHELVPMASALLAVALVSEIVACLRHPLSQRVLPALAADFAIWQLVDVMTSSKGVPEGYHATTPAMMAALCLALPAIYGGSIGVRSLVLGRRIAYFDVGQTVLAFVLATFGSLRATQGAIAPVLGGLFLVLGAMCYWGALSTFVGDTQTRNRRVSATWAAALMVAGNWLLLPENLQVPFLCVAAVVAAFLYSSSGKFSLGLHATIYLVAATAVAPISAYVMNAMAGSVPGAPTSDVWMVVVAAVLCYVVGARRVEDKTRRRVLWVVPALLVGFAVAALAVSAVVGLAPGREELAASRLSVVRTIMACAVALALGYLGSRWKRAELGWVAYTAVGFGTLKLLLEDLRFGNAASLVVSLLFYGMVLILLPRMMQRGRKEGVGAT